ncbi:MAG: hypothetical protein LQ341_001434 [Variospora aurantia]|nr:MAG: hypothetical protein LQ341_001434 [Variospora aurantia]
MSDNSAEEVFLRSMKEKADAEAVQYEADGANGKQTESTSSDEYDPAQAVPDTFSPNPAQDHLLSSGVVTQNLPHQSSDRPSSAAGNIAATGLLDQAVDENGGRSQSQSMSGSSSSVSSPVNIQTSNVPFHMDGSTDSAIQENASLPNASSHGAEGAEPQSPAIPSPNFASGDTAAYVQTQNNPSGELFLGVTQNGVVHTDSDKPTSFSEAALQLESRGDVEVAPERSTFQDSETKASASMPQKSTPAAAVPKARLPNDTIGILEDRIQEDPRGDTNAWLSLIDEYRKRGKIEEARATYERFFVVFPAAAEQWGAYIQMENEAHNLPKVEHILSTILRSLPNLRLWSIYLDHIRRRNDITRDTTGSSRQTITQAYEVALDNIGIDKDSGYLWQEYIQFLKSKPGETGGPTWQGQQKMDQLRDAYRKAIKVPTQATQSLWKEYDQFEMSMNKTTGRKFLQEESPAYMTARSSFIAISNITRNLRRSTLPNLPPALGFDGDREYGEQLDIWKQWIQWEKDDPLVLKDGTDQERQQWRDRVAFVYKQAVMSMRFWPEMWFDAATFCFENDMESVGNHFLVQGINANPESCLLAFKRADRIESTTPNEEGDDGIARRGAAVREPYDRVLDALYDLITKTKARESQELQKIEARFAATSEEQRKAIDEDDDDNADQDETDSVEKRKVAQLDAIKGGTAMQIALLSKAITSAWIALMRAMRRVQGKGKVGDKVGGSRQIFTDARKRGRLTYDIYVASAMIEYHCYEPEATKKIFERGLKLFPEDELFALEYIKHLMLTNDSINARVIFETVVNKLTSKPETLSKAKPLYAFFHDFESKYGEHTQIIKLEKRMKEHFPDDPSLSAFSRRFVQPGFDPTALRPIISPAAQTRPRAISDGEPVLPVHGSPLPRPGQPTNSPKRALPLDDSDNDAERPRKLARGESPLKGAAGRRLEQQKRTLQPQGAPQPEYNLPPPAPPSLPPAITHILGNLPKASHYPAAFLLTPEKVLHHVRAMDFQKVNRVYPVGSSQPRAPPSMPPRLPPQQMPPHLQQPMPQHPPSAPPMSGIGMPNPYIGGYPASSYHQPMSSFPPPQQVPAPSGNVYYPGPNSQAVGHGSMQGTGYSYGQGNMKPHYTPLYTQ